jgi:hypothetical protein
MRRALLTGIMALALWGSTAVFSEPAHASTVVGRTGYVCGVTYYPFAGTFYGNFGALGLTVYSGPNCSGSFVGSVFVFSTGATGKGVCVALRSTDSAPACAGLCRPGNNLWQPHPDLRGRRHPLRPLFRRPLTPAGAAEHIPT